MAKKDEYFYLGKITRTVGNKGELAIYLDVDEAEKYRQLDAVFVDINDELIPFFIEKIRIRHNSTAVVAITDINNVEQAQFLINRKLYLPVALLPKLKGNKFYYHEVTGFEVIDKNHGSIGTIAEILDYPHQAIFRILFDKKEILIPVSDEIIRKVDRNKHQIHIEAPSGLIEIYI